MTILAAMVMALAALPVQPDASKTPGAVRALTTEQVCSIQWGKDVRHVTERMKKESAARYGLAYPVADVEWDHLIPRELGGADATDNLWPQAWTQARRLKDPAENRLHRQVCVGTLSLAAAQEQMRQWHP